MRWQGVVCALILSMWSCMGVWTRFDLVRPIFGAIGSNQTTSYVKITSDSICTEQPVYTCQPFNITTVKEGSSFGYAVANLGDLDGDGIDDIAVGAPGDEVDYGGSLGIQKAAGSVYILFMAENATVRHFQRISGNVSNGPEVFENDQFGFALAGIGDLDGDGIVDLAVGAPGYLISSVFVLFLRSDGNVRNHTLIRGPYQGQVPDGLNQTSQTFNITRNQNYTFNGPPITYGNRFASALANIGDVNADGVTDLAVGQVDTRTGRSSVYLLFLNPLARVISFKKIAPNVGGGPNISDTFTRFGASVQAIPDLDGNGLSELVVGAPALYESGSLNPNAGTIFVLFMLPNGSVNGTATKAISETSSRRRFGLRGVIPFVPYDECGSSLAFIGDINRDQNKQRRPEQISQDQRPSIPDVIMGCPGGRSNAGAGRMFFVFLTLEGQLAGSTVLPAASDSRVIDRDLRPYDLFGQSLAGYRDADGNGLREVVVGAPGDDGRGANSGAVYVIFPRRRRWHWVPFDFLTYILIVTLVPGLCCMLCVSGCVFFFWYYRRIPDEAEIIVKQAGIQIGKVRPRTRYAKSAQVYCEQYTS